LRIPPPHLPWASLRHHRIGGANDHCLNRRSRLVRLDQEAYRQGDAGLDRYWPRPAGSQEESGWLRAFIKWVESEVGIVRRSAQAYMALAKLADDNGAAIALLPPTTAHRLAAKSAPPDVVSEVVAKALSGEVLPDRTVAKWSRSDPVRLWAASVLDPRAPDAGHVAGTGALVDVKLCCDRENCCGVISGLWNWLASLGVERRWRTRKWPRAGWREGIGKEPRQAMQPRANRAAEGKRVPAPSFRENFSTRWDEPLSLTV
jgi:hypothetical protein